MMPPTPIERSDSLDLQTLAARYRSGQWTPRDVARAVVERIEAHGDSAVWIDRVPPAEIQAQAARAEERKAKGEALPLYGVPFAVKDNIDVAGRPTTAACPAFAYVAQHSAAVVDKLCDAGAILVGKTNLDQFATGLVGVRSPYGACRNTFDPRYISGGSSSGSAVAVAAGLVSFALGTDTAGSGRVPAAFNNLVGLKPTRGLLSTRGVVPACRSLDCVSVFALTCGDAAAVTAAAQGFDPADPFSRRPADVPAPPPIRADGFRFGVPRDEDLRFFGNAEAERLYRQSIDRMAALGGTAVPVDYTPFARAAGLLYDGPWLAERLAAVEAFFTARPDALLPVTRGIIEKGRNFDAASAFKASYELRSLVRQAQGQWKQMDFLLLPTAGTIYTLAQVEADPVALNTNLGYSTNFVNLMDLCGVAVPAGLQTNGGAAGLPFGVSLVGRAGQETDLLTIADRFHRAAGLTVGATGAAMPAESPIPPAFPAPPRVKLAVVGAHLAGQPLNHQLTERRATLARACRTAPAYRLYALPGTTPPKPGLARAGAGEGGHAIAVEVWEMSAEAFGTFVAAIPPPLGVGTIELEDGERVKSFLCEGYALAGARDISSFGGWLNFLRNG